MKKLLLLAALGLVPISALAQKGPIDELGFHPEKLYDFSGVDSVNLFNGNLVVAVPIGPRYSVGSTLSYQFTYIYNGKSLDQETWLESDPGGGNDLISRSRTLPNLRSNAGVGGRVSLGRLLPPYDTGKQDDSLTDISWVYEGPAGDEHALGVNSDEEEQVNAFDGLRMHRLSDSVREVEFASGEVHQFVLDHSVWRLQQMRDRFNNAVNITYTLSANNTREEIWHISDTAGRTHSVQFVNYSAMADGWSRGQNVSSIYLQKYGGGHDMYNFNYTPTGGSNCYWNGLPWLTSLTQPDGTQFSFSFPGSSACAFGSLSQIRYPTGGTVSYTYAGFSFVPQNTICGLADTAGVETRTIADGATPRTWKYVYQQGPLVAFTPPYYDPCNTGQTPPISYNGPVYWARTSVLTPADAGGHRVRTDHYFSTFTDQLWWLHVDHHWPGEGLQKYGHSGAIGVPSASTRHKGASDLDAVDVDGSDGVRLLSTEVYADCDATGDCTQGTLLRSTWDRYDGDVYPNRPYGHPIDTARLMNSRTVYEDDNGCGGKCFTNVEYQDDNGANRLRKTIATSNFVGAHDVTSITQYPTWTPSDLTNPAKTFLLNTFSEKTREENGATAHEQFCFEPTTGFLQRHRVLGADVPRSKDVLSVFEHDSNGNVQYISTYGGDAQGGLGEEADVCSASHATPFVYKVKQTFSPNGAVASSQSYDPATSQLLTFKSVDRDVDSTTGLITKSRDTALRETSLTYSGLPAQLDTITPPGGPTTTYSYTPASGTVGVSGYTPPKANSTTPSTTAGTLRSEFVYDGMGRLVRQSHLGPQIGAQAGATSNWSATETSLDEIGRVAWVSQPVSTGTNPPTGPLSAAHKTTYTYDPFGRPLVATGSDGKTTTYSYVGVRERRTKVYLATTSDTNTPVTTAEKYDQNGRLSAVTEAEGTSAAATTTYGYDVGNHLKSVTSGAQTRLFTYDLRGFLTSEEHPENGKTSYKYDARGHAERRLIGDSLSAFDLKYEYDGAERLVKVYQLLNRVDQASGDQTRPLKEFTFATANDGANYKLGKLESATRLNYSPLAGVIEVKEAYDYGNATHADAAGRLTDKTTTIKSDGALLQKFTQSYAYNDLSLPATLTYPTCADPSRPCGSSTLSSVSPTYSVGVLKTIPSFVSDIEYAPNGMIARIDHAGGVTDTITAAANGMARPDQIAFGDAGACAPPAIQQQPAPREVQPYGSTSLSVSAASGTPALVYQWFRNDEEIPMPGEAGMTLSLNPVIVTTRYHARISNSCGAVNSNTVSVTVCGTPTISNPPQSITIPGNQGTELHVEAQYCGTVSYQWYRVDANNQSVAVGTNSSSLQTGILTATTRYWVRVTSSVGPASADSPIAEVTVTCTVSISTQPESPTISYNDSTTLHVSAVSCSALTYRWYLGQPLNTSTFVSTGVTTGGINQLTVTPPRTATYWVQATDAENRTANSIPAAVTVRPPVPTSVSASVGGGGIVVSWQGSAFADHYKLQRCYKFGCSDFPAASGIVDGVGTGMTYVYRVASVDSSGNGISAYSNADVATTLSFTPIVPGVSLIRFLYLSELLDGLNAVRAAGGSLPTNWTEIYGRYAPSHPTEAFPLPGVGVAVCAAQLKALRWEMDTALNAVGVTNLPPYTDVLTTSTVIKAIHFTQLRDRTQ